MPAETHRAPDFVNRHSSIVMRQSSIVNDYRSILPKVRMYGSQITSPNPFPRLKPGATIPGRAYRRCVCTALEDRKSVEQARGMPAGAHRAPKIDNRNSSMTTGRTYRRCLFKDLKLH